MKLLTCDTGSGPRAGVIFDGDLIHDASALLGSLAPLRDVRAVLEFADGAVELLRAAAGRVAAPTVRLSEARLRRPVLQPPTVRDYIAFRVPVPAATRQLDYECELAVVIAREGSNVLERDADRYIAGFTIFNDWSSRDLQADESQFGLGPAKGKDSASSLGPWIVTPDEMAPYYRNGTLHVG